MFRKEIYKDIRTKEKFSYLVKNWYCYSFSANRKNPKDKDSRKSLRNTFPKCAMLAYALPITYALPVFEVFVFNLTKVIIP